MENKSKQGMLIKPGPVVGRTKIPGLCVDFNLGARVQVPEGKWRVRLIDRDTFMVLTNVEAENQVVSCSFKYYINYRVEVYQDEKLAFALNYDDKKQRVLMKSVSDAIGDNIAWIPYAEEYRRKHDCEVWYSVAEPLRSLLAPNYPEIHFVGQDEAPEGRYATYYLGNFFPADDRTRQPVDWRIVGLQRSAAYILGLEPREIPAHIAPTDTKRRIRERYVCIAAQASSQAKYWNNPNGWYETIKYLKSLGYRVLCIDKNRFYGQGFLHNGIPYGAEDFTGDLPLAERVNLLAQADFFIGLPSGLSWLAWAAGTPVVLISGFSLPIEEFSTPYRVINYRVCNGCWNDTSCEFVHDDFEWCPRHKGDIEKQFICTRVIASQQVRAAIDRLMQDKGLTPPVQAGKR